MNLTLGIGKRYRHYRNYKEYKILFIGTSTVDDKPVVIYQALYDDPKFGNNHVWVRSLHEFAGTVAHEGTIVSRFTLVEE